MLSGLAKNSECLNFHHLYCFSDRIIAPPMQVLGALMLAKCEVYGEPKINTK